MPGVGEAEMSPAWIALGITAAGVVALAYAAPRARAAEQTPRVWAIERCTDAGCDMLPARYSGPTSCNVDIASERIGRQQPNGARLVCVRDKGDR